MPEFEIRILRATPEIIAALSHLLIETVAYGGSVSFMHPLQRDTAGAFWRDALAAAASGERIILGAYQGEELLGTVTLLLAFPQNQPHRAEIAKMMTRVGSRGQGVGSALIKAAERMAIERARTLLVLDTAQDEGAAGFYEKLGFTLAGTIPDYALKPHGGLTGTMLYWKQVG